MQRVTSSAPAPPPLPILSFNADVSTTLQWTFVPEQKEITVIPGETALAFYRATNPTDEAIIGIASYNVVPFEVGRRLLGEISSFHSILTTRIVVGTGDWEWRQAAQYFNKIQCVGVGWRVLDVGGRGRQHLSPTARS